MVNHIRLFLGLEAAVFIAAALIHFGVVLDGYNDQEAGTAESVIAIVLLAGLLTSLLRPDWTRRAGILVQGFALVGTFVGLTLLVTLGPRTLLDIAIHVVDGGPARERSRRHGARTRNVSGRVTSGN